jgi:UDP-3-O-[3-hydroxymyristoyl] glucosamine N-acyltransferase
MEITGVAGIEQAGPDQITFLANPKYAHKVKQSRAGAILVSQPLANLPIVSVISSNPYLDFARALALFYNPPRPEPGIHPLAFIHETAVVGENASIAPFAYVGKNVRIGRNAVLHPHVVVYEGVEIGDDFYAHAHASIREYCKVGDRVVLQNGAVIGGDGYGFAKRSDGSHEKIVQSGVTVIEDDVEVQSLTSVDRATIGETRVKRGAKIDSLVQIGHACTGRGGQHHLRTDRLGRKHGAGAECPAGWPSRRLRPFDHSRKCRGVRAERRRRRRARRVGDLGQPGVRSAGVVAGHHGIPQTA